jgi:cell division control protein 6
LEGAFLPKIVPYREEQQRRIANAINPLFSDRNGKNLIIYGMPGVGKTVAMRKVLAELEEKSDEIEQVFVNCWERNTSYKVIMKMCEILGYVFTQNKKTDELIREVIKILNKKKAVFVFDEIDKAEEYDFLYSILENVYRKCIILITNHRDFFEEMDERLRSRLMPEMIEFRPYNIEETGGILKQRVEAAFYPGVWETDAFEEAVKKTFELKDMRKGIYLLKDAGEYAEGKSSRKVSLGHVENAIKKADEAGMGKASKADDGKIIAEIIKNNSGKKIGELFEAYHNAGGDCSYKTFQRRIAELEENGFVKLTRKSGGDGGNTTIVEYKERVKGLEEFNS